jgi:hypothetical protein
MRASVGACRIMGFNGCERCSEWGTCSVYYGKPPRENASVEVPRAWAELNSVAHGFLEEPSDCLQPGEVSLDSASQRAIEPFFVEVVSPELPAFLQHIQWFLSLAVLDIYVGSALDQLIDDADVLRFHGAMQERLAVEIVEAGVNAGLKEQKCAVGLVVPNAPGERRSYV